MVQGTTKGLQGKPSGSNARRAHKAAANTKKGRRTVAPKKAANIKHAAMHKALSAKINKSVEQQMVTAASSGKLTIMKPAVIESANDPAAKSKRKTQSVNA